MLYEFCSVIFFIVCLFLIFIVVRQKSHGGFWSGPASNDSTIIFGGNSGADILQKITWVCGFILLFGTLFLSIYKTRMDKKSKYASVIKHDTSDKNLQTNESSELPSKEESNQKE